MVDAHSYCCIHIIPLLQSIACALPCKTIHGGKSFLSILLAALFSLIQLRQSTAALLASLTAPTPSLEPTAAVHSQPVTLVFPSLHADLAPSPGAASFAVPQPSPARRGRRRRRLHFQCPRRCHTPTHATAESVSTSTQHPLRRPQTPQQRPLPLHPPPARGGSDGPVPSPLHRPPRTCCPHRAF